MRHVSYRILIVDDSEAFRRTAAQLLAKRGFESAGAVADGEAALAAVRNDCPDGILLRTIARGHKGCLGVYGSVVSGGLVQVDDPVVLHGPS